MRARPEHAIYTFCADSGEEVERLTLAELDARARAIAVRLHDRCPAGERALLLFQPGLSFISAFLGCLYAGVVAVPVVPPRRNRGQERLAAVAADARPKVALIDSSALDRVRQWGRELPGAADWLWLDVDGLAPDEGRDWTGPEPDPAALAFLQYTSGSTSVPKGVMVSHRNLAANQRLITAGFRQTAGSVVVGWLPVYHDMGLIGNVLQPLWSGSRCILMSPLTFLQKPVRWLEAISRYGATTSGGPSFAYELCVQKVMDEQKAGLDLSRWEVAFNGAEPVRADTLDRFAAAFAPCGFRRQAFAPCFGLAEATLLVTVAGAGAGPRVAPFAAAALEQGVAVPGTPGEGPAVPSRRLVGCGTAPAGVDVRIVDPESGIPCAEGRVGEIWVAGESIAKGYWERPELTAETFGARLAAAAQRRYLRTGDLGFLADGGELFVTGRLKDLIIIRGRNHYPQDVELTVERSHPALRPGCGAAFSVESEGEERLVVVQEVERRSRAAPEELVDAIRQAVAEQHDVAVHGVVLLEVGSLPKTTSGKVQRRRCRDLYLQGKLAAAGRLAAPQPAPAAAAAASRAATEPAAGLLSTLREIVAQALRIAPSALDAGRPLTAQGLDSLTAFEVRSRVEAALGVAPDPADLLAGVSLEEIAGALLASPARAAEAAAAPASAAAGTAGAAPLTRGQRAIWFLQRLAPRSAAYNLSVALRVLSPFDPEAFERALGGLLARHESLRSRFPVEDDEPVRRVAPEAAMARVPLERVDASQWSSGKLAERLAVAAHHPFDLERGPLLSAALFSGAGELTLLVSVHHIAVDFQSLAVVARDLGQLYEGELRGGAAGLPPPAGGDLGRYAAWEERQAGGTEGERGWEYWREALGGELPDLDLPTDRPRPRHQGFRGGARSLRLEAGLATGVAALGRQRSATLFSTLLAAFQALLHHHSGLDDLLVGTPASCRAAAQVGELVGYLVNPVVLRGRFAGAPAFGDLVAQAHAAAVGALRHQGFPFPLLAERLAPARDASRPPLFQAMFVLHRGQSAAEALLADLAVGEPGVHWDLGGEAGGVRLASAPLEVRSSQLDLSLAVAESHGELALRLVFDSDLFDGSTAERLLGHLRSLLTAAVANPSRPVAELPLLTPAEEAQLAAWNRTGAVRPPDLAVHELFAQQVERTPAAVAVAWDGRQLSYRELAARAADVARRLRGLGAVPQARVGLLLGRTPELLAGLLGTLAAGGAFVPLDPGYPVRRLELMARDAGIAVLVVDPSTAGLLPDLGATLLVLDGSAPAAAAAPLAGVATHPGDVAYVLYTSGSTGRPKGVMVPHCALANVLLAIAREAEMGPADVVLSFTTPSFDIGILELLLPLVTGGRLALLPTETGRDGAALATAMAAHRPTLVQATPASWSLLLESPPPRDPGLKAFCGGEAMSGTLADGLRALAGRAWNMYGPTETAVYSAIFDLARGTGAPPIGRPVANTRCQVLSAALRQVPVGVSGELCIAGAGVARGYLGRPDLTAERFLPDPFSPHPGGRLYRTGDLARWRHDGEIEYLGRIDRQVKVRGYRIELGEIQERLRSHPGVQDAVVLAWADETGERRLVAYHTAAGERPAASGELAAFLREHLPEFMVPAAFIALEALPLTPNGKVDVRALPEPRRGAPSRADVVPPRSPVEQWVGEIWAGVLGVERVGAGESFFELGGHSLRAAQVIARARKVFGVDLPLRALFEAPTVEAFARQVEAARRGVAAAASPPAEPLLPAPAEAPAAASFAQRRLWFLDRLQPGLAAYDMPAAVELRGDLAAGALAAALGEIVRRHEVLRTRFPAAAGEPVPVVEPAARLDLGLADLSALPAATAAAAERRLAAEEAARPFDLAAGPVLRCRLLRLGPSHHTLLLNVHHVAADGASLGLFVGELEALYAAFAAALPSPLPPLPLQYRDYAAWQRRGLAGGAARELHLEHWRAKLAGVQPLEMPTDRPRQAVQSFRGHRAASLLPPRLAGPVSSLARREGATPFVVLGAALAVLLQRYARQGEVILGTPFDGRDRVELEPLIGLFVQLLPLRLRAGEGTAGTALLHQVREELLTAWEHRDLPFELLVEEIQPHRAAGRAPLVQATLAYERHAAGRQAGTLVTRVEGIDNGTAKFDLSLFARESAAGLALTLEVSSDLFDRTTAQRLLDHFERLLAGLAAAPGVPLAALPLLGEAERQQITVEWNDTQTVHAGEVTVCDLFEAQARSFPEAPAVVTDETTLTYGELERRANRLASFLSGLGVAPESLVAILLPRSPELVLAALAVLKAGGAYLPLDPQHPRERVRSMLEDSGARVVLTAAGILDGEEGIERIVLDIHRALEEAAPEAPLPPPRALTPESLAYVIYTSGSTGRPKGVAISHRGLANLVGWHLRAYGVVPTDRATLAAAPAFDASVWETWPYLCAGASLTPLSFVQAAAPAALVGELARLGATFAFLPTPLAEAVLADPDAPRPLLRALLTGGDRLKRAYPEAAVRLMNHYGPTEATVVTSWAPVARNGRRQTSPAIGRPIDNLRVHVLDERLRAVPIGVAGELHIAGDGLARGYLGQPAATAERFIPSPFALERGERLYCTGDLVRLLPDGSLEFLGRADRQVKIRGFRVEPGEIESRLLQHGGVHQAVVSVWKDPYVGPRLAAHVVPRNTGAPPSPAELRGWLKAALPDYMVPSAFRMLDHLPLNANGKVDLAVLPPLDADGDVTSAESAATVLPVSPLEEILAGLWSELLGPGRIGSHDNFFELGGHSLQVARLQARIQEELGVELPLDAIFRQPTLAELAEAVAERLVAGVGEEVLQGLLVSADTETS
ncbi:MAG: amino acid adenylation domain-containing protein [Acidobacteria bacterium]|nr:amino acid adenylation domain-containing protein [Acidobacteriota bacterium]